MNLIIIISKNKQLNKKKTGENERIKFLSFLSKFKFTPVVFIIYLF